VAFGLVNLPKLECCGGRCSCPAGGCSCGKGCDGDCAEHGQSMRSAAGPLSRRALDATEATPWPPARATWSCCATQERRPQ